MPGPEVNVGYVIVHSRAVDVGRLRAFARRMVEDARPELERASGARWVFHAVEPASVEDDDPRRPSDFLDEAALRMVEGPYDVMVVVTDVGLVSRRHAVVAGLGSEVSRVAVVSTRKLLVAPRGRVERSLEDESVRWNAGALLLHLMGHVLGARPGLAGSAGDAVAPFAFEEGRQAIPRFGARASRFLRRAVVRVPEREMVGGGLLRTLAFHLSSAFLHPRHALLPILRSRAPLLSLALPGLATAAVVPTFILVFTAEIWDVGLNMPDGTAWGMAVVTILAATWYLTLVQNLFFPRKEKRVLTEHMAIVNVAIFLSMLLAVVGLFVMLVLLMMAIETLVFPPGLISTWPTLQDPEVLLVDKVRLAVFIGSLGVITGALAGGLESRTVIRHLALFPGAP